MGTEARPGEIVVAFGVCWEDWNPPYIQVGNSYQFVSGDSASEKTREDLVYGN